MIQHLFLDGTKLIIILMKEGASAVCRSLLRRFNPASHLPSGDLSRSHDQVRQELPMVSPKTSADDESRLFYVTRHMISSGSVTLVGGQPRDINS